MSKSAEVIPEAADPVRRFSFRRWGLLMPGIKSLRGTLGSTSTVMSGTVFRAAASPNLTWSWRLTCTRQ